METTKYTVQDGSIYDENGEKVDFIRVKSKKCHTTDGKEFKAYGVLCSNSRIMDLSFTMDCGSPNYDGNFLLINPQYSIDTHRQYPRVYISSYEAILDFKTKVKDTFEFVKSAF